MSDNDQANQSRAKSGELLRLVLGQMGTHAAGYDPTSYALWYEYVRGGSPRLREEIDAFVADQQRLTAEQTRHLHDRHVRSQPDAAFAKARVGLLSVLDQLHKSIDEASIDRDEYDLTLKTFEGDLAQTDELGDIQRQLATVVAHTSEMRGSMGALSDELTNNKAQVGRLTEELNRLREDVLTDPLTGLANRRGFDTAIASLHGIAAAGNEAFSIVMIDIDHFKNINDTHGHLIGDRVLQQVASVMRACVRGGDTAARYGGEEFALLLPGTGAHGAQTVAEYIRKALQRTTVNALRGGAVDSITVSAGVTAFKSGDGVDDCIRRADQAMYAAKNAGRNRVVVL